MKLARKQAATLGLLLLTALPLLFSAGIFIKQKIIQNQRRERFETELLQTITVSAESIYWVKPGKEILTDGKLFDVKSFKTSGANILLTGFYDNKEDKLVKFRELIHDRSSSDSPANLLVVKFLFYPQFKENTDFTIQNNWQIIAHQFQSYTQAIHRLSFPVPAPPPKYC